MANYNADDVEKAVKILMEYINHSPMLTKKHKKQIHAVFAIMGPQLAIARLMENLGSKVNNPGEINELYDRLFP